MGHPTAYAGRVSAELGLGVIRLAPLNKNLYPEQMVAYYFWGHLPSCSKRRCETSIDEYAMRAVRLPSPVCCHVRSPAFLRSQNVDAF